MNMKRMHTKDERGIVSIVVVVMLMIVISLIIIGFARITRREQRQALDREINTQAFYAAETGTNDAINKIKTNPALLATDYMDTCNGFMLAAGLNGEVNGSGGNSSYSCLFVDPTPTSFEFGNVDTNSSKIIPITPKDPVEINSITIGWQDKAGGTISTNCGWSSPTTLPPANSWTCATGVLRVDLVPVGGSGITLSRDYLLANSMTIFLYPSNGGGTSTSQATIRGPGNQGFIRQVDCVPQVSGTSKQCNLSIINLNAINGAANTQVKYMMRLRSIYRASAVSISAYTSAAPSTAIELKDGQAIVDTTGKSTDVLRRTQVRVPLANFSNAPEFAAQTVETLCKRFKIAPAPAPNDYQADTVAPTGDPTCDVIN